LDQFARQTERMVLLSPAPFEKPQPPYPDLSVHNDDLRLYVDAIRDLARQRRYAFVDLFAPFREAAQKGLNLTQDGFQLTSGGHRATAIETARQLGIGQAAHRAQSDPAKAVMQPDSIEQLRRTIQAKNRLWFNYWRPMN